MLPISTIILLIGASSFLFKIQWFDKIMDWVHTYLTNNFKTFASLSSKDRHLKIIRFSLFFCFVCLLGNGMLANLFNNPQALQNESRIVSIFFILLLFSSPNLASLVEKFMKSSRRFFIIILVLFLVVMSLTIFVVGSTIGWEINYPEFSAIFYSQGKQLLLVFSSFSLTIGSILFLSFLYYSSIWYVINKACEQINTTTISKVPYNSIAWLVGVHTALITFSSLLIN